MDIQKEYTGLLEAFNSVYTSQEVEQLDEGMTMKDFKQQRSRQKQKDKREAEKTSPTRRAGIHNPEKAPERAARRDAAYGETGHGGALRPNKVRKAKALGELDEATYSAKAARAGEDIGKPGKAFAKIAKEAGKRYGSEERGKKVAGAVLAKLRAEETDLFDYILEHLVAEGYADTNKAALAIMANMSEEWKQSIVEEVLDEEEGSYGATPKAYGAARQTRMTAKRKPFLKKMLRRTNPANRTPDDSPRKGMTSDDRERARAGAAHGVSTRQDHDYPSEGPGGVTKSAKKLRKQKAMGEHD
jgi:hypothetical protein